MKFELFLEFLSFCNYFYGNACKHTFSIIYYKHYNAKPRPKEYTFTDTMIIRNKNDFFKKNNFLIFSFVMKNKKEN